MTNSEITRIFESDSTIADKLLPGSLVELDAIFSSIPDVILVYDTNMNVRKTNPAFIKKYGFDPVGLNVKDIITIFSCRHLNNEPFILEDQPTPQALKGETISGKIFSITVNGIDKIVETSASPLTEQGEVTGSIVVWHEINDPHFIHKALNKSEELHRKTNEYSPIAIYVIRDGILDYANPAGLKLLGAKHILEISGKPIDFFVDPKTSRKDPSFFQTITSEKRSGFLEQKIIRKDGSLLDIEIMAVNISDENTKAAHLFVRDITFAKKNEKFNSSITTIEQTLFSSVHNVNITEKVMELTANAIECDSAAVSNLNGDFWEVKHIYNFPDYVKNIPIPYKDEPHAIMALEEKQMQIIEDAYNDPRTNNSRLQEWGIKSVIVVPLFTKYKNIGVICFNYYSKKSFNEEIIAFLNRASTALSLALENTELFENLQKEFSNKQKNESKLIKLNQILMAISRSSQAMVHVNDENEYIKQICNIIIDESKFALAWVGFIESDIIKPTIWSGSANTYAENLKVEITNNENFLGPIAVSIRKKSPQVCNDLQTMPWGEQATSFGLFSSISLPLMYQSEVYGVLKIYSKEKGAFATDEILLLTELAKYLSQGIITLRAKAEKKEAENSLKENEERFRLLAEKSNAFICELDTYGKILYINEKFKQAFGPINKIVAEIKKFLADQLNTDKKSSLQSEWKYKDKNGEWHWFGSHKSKFHTSSGEVRYSFIIFEITSIKKAEARLKELNATKDKFFSIIAHDLKNPFTSLIGASEFLAKNADNFDTASIQSLANILYDSSKRGYALLQNLLEWSRSQTDTISFNPLRFNLSELIEECVENVIPYAKNKNQEINLFFPKSIEVLADKNMFNTVLRNLIHNAIKFTNQGGMIEISTFLTEDSLTVLVQDTGIGISDENIKKLFRIDTQFTNLGTNKEQGTGLGLLLCKEFIEKHNGKIGVESIENVGSTFYFTIPKYNFFNTEE